MITIYELLGLVKDGKAPKKIKFNGRIYEFESEFNDYYNDMHSLLENEIKVITKYFNDKVEIIEEEKEIEKLNIEDGSNRKERTMYIDGKPNELSVVHVEISKKINELIEEINRLKKED